MLKIIAVLSLLFISVNAYAACGQTACEGKIDTVYVTSNGTVYIGTNGDETSLNCTAVANVYITLASDNPDRKLIYATLLTAKTSDQQVVIRIVEESSNCELDWIRLDPS